MNVLWKAFVVTLRVLWYPTLTGFGLFLGAFLAALYLALFIPFVGFNFLAFCFAAIANDRKWRDDVVDDAIGTVKQCFRVVIGFFLSPVSVAVWAFTPLFSERKKKLYWLTADEQRHAGDAE